MLHVTAVIAVPTSLLCVVMFFWGGRFVALLYGHQYAGNGLIVTILVLNLLVTAAAFPFTRALFAIERADVDFLGNFVALFIMVTLGLWLVRAFGPLGAALGLLGAGLVTSAAKAGAFLRLPTSITAGREADSMRHNNHLRPG